MKYRNMVIPTIIQKKGERYIKFFDVYLTNVELGQYGIAWMRCGDSCTLPKLLRKIPHIVFEVENVEEAIKNKEVLIKPFYPSHGGEKAVFIVENGVPVGFVELIKNKS